MARVKDWLIDMECAVHEALEQGHVDIKEIIMYCKKAIGHVDENYIRECVRYYDGNF
jgi:hypothetical protein